MGLNEKLNTYPGSRGGEAPEEANQPLARILIGSSALTTGVLGLSGCGPSSTEIRPTPTPEPEAQPTNLVFTLAKEKQNDPDFQKLNQANTSFFQEFKNRNPQNPWQLGETVALGAGNVDYALTTVVGPNGKPILGVISYLDKDGKLQSGFAIDFVTTIPSDDGGRTFGGIYPLKPEIYKLLLEGKTVTIDPKKDTQGPIFGFVLRQGKNWTDFSAAMNQATTEEQRQRVFSIYVDEIYLQKPDGKTHLFSISKLSPSEQTQLVSYALLTATPESIELTPTPKPSPTPTITPTPQTSPTPEPTPIPTIEVNGLQLPDPRATNPELFDLTKKEAPIPQFVNALKNAGIELSPEQIAQGITYVSTKEDGTPLVDKDGNPFVVAVYNLDPSLFPEQYRSLAGPIPLMIAKKGENGWKWRTDRIIPLRLFSGQINLIISNLESHYDRSGNIILNVFDGLSITWYLKWDLVETKQGIENYEEGKKYVNLAKKNDMEPILGPIIYKYEYPAWLEQSNLSNEELEQAIRNRVRSILQRFKGDIKYAMVVNEFHPTPYEKDYLYSRLGERYVEIAFDEARKANPEAILIYNDGAIESPRWPWYKSTYDLVRKLKAKGLIDAVGMQGHFNQPNWTKVPSNEEFIQAIRSFRQLGLDVYITEMDVSLTEKQGNDRFLHQADIYYNLIKTYLEETKDQKTRIINFFGWRDNHSWIEKDLGNYPNADPLLIDDNGNPKLAYYALLKLLFETNLR